jgi:hypothetical protein
LHNTIITSFETRVLLSKRLVNPADVEPLAKKGIIREPRERNLRRKINLAPIPFLVSQGRNLLRYPVEWFTSSDLIIRSPI